MVYKPLNSIEEDHSYPKDSWNILKLIRWGNQYLAHRGFETPRLDCELLLSFSLKLERVALYANYDRPLSSIELSEFRKLIERRLNHEPIAYITGKKEFMGFDFSVTKDVLIPRPDTELLVERVAEFIRSNNLDQITKKISLLEIGIGSGCIGLSLLKMFDNLILTGWEISSSAICVAKENAKKLNIEESRYNFLVKDALIEKSWQKNLKFSIIVSNPPYIRQEELETLPLSVRNFEPHKALFAEENGLSFYKAISRYGFCSLENNGHVFFEMGYKQSNEVIKIFVEEGWKEIGIYKDYSGYERVGEFRYGRKERVASN